MFKSAGVIEPVAQMLTPLVTNLSLSAWWQLNKHCYTSFGRLPFGRLPIGYRLIHVRRPYTDDRLPIGYRLIHVKRPYTDDLLPIGYRLIHIRRPYSDDI